MKLNILTPPRGGYYIHYYVITRTAENEDMMIETYQGKTIEAKSGLTLSMAMLYHMCLILCPQPSLLPLMFLPSSKILFVCFDLQKF